MKVSSISKTNISDSYLQVLKLVKSGVTIQNACITTGVCRVIFYKNITKEQKEELRFYKATTQFHGSGHGWGTRDFMTLELEDDDE